MPRVRTLGLGLGLSLVAWLLVPASPVVATTTADRRSVEPPPLARGLPESGSVLGYQCGTGVCLVDPDEGATPVLVVPDGTFAGVTADGDTVAWVQPNGDLVTAPTTGGAPTAIYTGDVGIQPLISPNGKRVLWTSPVAVCIDYYCYYYTYRLDVDTGQLAGVGACACAASHGFAGETSIGAYPKNNDRPSGICVIGTQAETGTSSACGSVIISDPRGSLSFPDGSADGQLFVAALDPANGGFGSSAGTIGLYSRATGGLIKDLTTNVSDTTPTLSPEGDRVAFERDDKIVILDITTGAERILGPGLYPSWGGTRSKSGGDHAVPKIKDKHLSVQAGKVTTKLTCNGIGVCQGTATLGPGKKVFAKTSYAVVAGRSAKVKLKLTNAGRQRFDGNGNTKLTLTLRGNGGEVRTKVTVRY